MRNSIIITWFILFGVSFGNVVKCAGMCQYMTRNYINGMCVSTYPYSPSGFRDNYICNPDISINGCPIGCKYEAGRCSSNLIILPQLSTISPLGCPNLQDSGNYYNLFCNPTGSGESCPSGCYHDNITNSCLPNVKDTICKSFMDWKCPKECQYNRKTGECNPSTDTAICGLIEKTLQCPIECSYNSQLKKCMSSNINTICGPEEGMYCARYCTSNPRGDICIPVQRTNNNYVPICDQISIKRCPNSCEFDRSIQKCIPNSIDIICEPIVKLSCPDNYYFTENNIQQCTRLNMYDICKIHNGLIQYPKRLNYDITTLKCKYIVDLDCSSMPGIITKCYQGCKLDSIKNQCIASYNTDFCGNVDIQCPSNYIRDNLSCYPRNNDSPLCLEKYKVMNISTSDSSIGYVLRCVPKWYYG